MDLAPGKGKPSCKVNAVIFDHRFKIGHILQCIKGRFLGETQ